MYVPAELLMENAQLHLRKKCRPENWREEFNGVKKPCWCGEEWTDCHEDGNHGPVWVQAQVRVATKEECA